MRRQPNYQLVLAWFVCAALLSVFASRTIGAELPDIIIADAAHFTALLASAAPERRIEGLQGLADLKYWHSENTVLRLLEDRSPEVRRAALLAVGRIGGARAVPHLIELLDDSSWDIRQNAWLNLRAMTAQHFGTDDRKTWERWWAESGLAQKEGALLSIARKPPQSLVGSGTNAVGDGAAFVPSAPGRRGRTRAGTSPPAHPERRESLRALARMATPSSEEALLQLLQESQSPALDVEERKFVCEALERAGSMRAVAVLAAQRSDAGAWALGHIGGVEGEQALLNFPKTLAVFLALDRLHSTNAAPWIPLLVSQMGQITYRSQPDDVMNDDLQPIQRVGVNLILRTGLAPLFVECVLQELEDTMKPPIAHARGPMPSSDWNDMFKRMRSELKPGFVREDGATTSQPIVAMCYLLGGSEASRRNASTRHHAANVSPSPLTLLPAEGRGEADAAVAKRLVPLLRHPAVVPRVYIALALGRMHAREALSPIVELIREGYTFSDSTALASGKHFDQSQTVRWRGFLCMALGRMGGDEARKALEQFATDSTQPRDIRYGSVVGLRFIRSPQSIPVLEKVAEQDVIWMVRDEARRTAEQIEIDTRGSNRLASQSPEK